MAKTKTKRAKVTQQQAEFKGMETPRIKELDEAAAYYEEGRDERMAASEVEVERKQALIELMHKHKLAIYRIPGTDPQREVVLVTEKEGVKVRAVKKATEKENGEL